MEGREQKTEEMFKDNENYGITHINENIIIIYNSCFGIYRYINESKSNVQSQNYCRHSSLF